MSKQTAVEWLHMKLDVYLELFPSEWQKLNEVIEQAKAMEREQIITAYGSDRYPCSDEDAEQYYNETYKGGEQ